MMGLTLLALLWLSNLGSIDRPGAELDTSHGFPDLASLRELYVAAVEDEAYIERAHQELELLRRNDILQDGPVKPSTLTAYEGALISLRAKHGSWPPSRLLHLREGLELLDAAIQEDPANAEARYLRLMTCYYLPGILGRGGSVREDFTALGRLLPGVAADYPPNVYSGIVRFVLKEGALKPEVRRALSVTLQAEDG